MIKVELTSDLTVIRSMATNPELYQMVNGTPYSKPTDGNYNLENFEYLIIHADDDLIGFFKFRRVTRLCIEAHINILPEHHKKGLAKEAVKQGLKWFKENREYKVVLTYVPANCFHVLKFLTTTPFVASGVIPRGINYAGELVELLLFCAEVK